MKKILSIALIMFTVQVFAQKPFPTLEEMTLGEISCGIDLSVKLHYDKNDAELIGIKCIDLPQSHPMYDDGMGGGNEVIMKVKVNRNVNTYYYVLFTTDPSCDPSFRFVSESGEYTGSIDGYEIYITGSGSVYAVQRVNAAYEMKKKYKLTDGKFTEVEPEFYQIGLKTKTLKMISLYSDEAMTKKLAVLPANYDIEVLLAKNSDQFSMKNKYLVKTAFGLVGWTNIEAQVQQSVEVDGIYWIGD